MKTDTALTQQAVKWLSDYLQIDTTNPPGREKAAADFLFAQFRALGIPAEYFPTAPDRGNVLGILKAEAPSADPILLQHHMDVVPANPKEWSGDPFDGRIENGHIYGRGALDMKSFGVMAMAAMASLKNTGRTLKRDILFLAAADEEMGGDLGTGWMVKHQWEKIKPAFVWDEGAFGLHGVFGPDPIFFVAVAEKQTVWTRMIAHGEPGLASIPHPQNPVLILNRALERINRHPFPPKLTPVPEEMFKRIGAKVNFPNSFFLRHLKNPIIWRIARGSLTQIPSINATLRNLVTPTQLKASLKENVIPSTAEATLDIRLLPGEDPHEMIQALSHIVKDKRISFILPEKIETSSTSDRESLFFKTLEATLTQAFPNALVVPMLTPGGTNSLFYRQQGINAYGLVPILIDQNELNRMHGIDERLSIQNLKTGIQIMTHVLEALCLKGG
jgi:acetylornithine deacetylase/succinyl-diaminopimelate desuccinylase-like protein